MFQCRSITFVESRARTAILAENGAGKRRERGRKSPPPSLFFCVVRSPPPLFSQTLFPLLRQKALQGQAAKAKQAAGAKAQKKGEEGKEV